jgi:hypothetical protein
MSGSGAVQWLNQEEQVWRMRRRQNLMWSLDVVQRRQTPYIRQHPGNRKKEDNQD